MYIACLLLVTHKSRRTQYDIHDRGAIQGKGKKYLMLVHPPQKTIQNNLVTISSQFEFVEPLTNIPDTLWYRIPEKYKDKISSHSDPFLPVALMMAMYTGEDLEIKGIVSPKLAYNLRLYRNIFHFWMPETFQLVEIHFSEFAKPETITGDRAVASAFSGGVDSFYTLWSHLPDNLDIPDAHLTHGLFIHGLDIRLDDEGNYQEAFQAYTELYAELGLELIPVTTNAFLFSEFRINMIYYIGVALMGSALLFSPWLKRFYVPSGMDNVLRYVPSGSSLITDYLLSNEATEIIHHGSGVKRYDKVALLSKWPATFHRYRVCSDKLNHRGLRNCSACHKCYSTMLPLKMLAADDNYHNFSKSMQPMDFIRWGMSSFLSIIGAIHMRQQAVKNRQYITAFWLQIAIYLQKSRNLLVKFIKSFLKQNELYQIKRKIYLAENHDRPSNPEKNSE